MAATTTSRGLRSLNRNAQRLIDFSLTLQKWLDFPNFLKAKNMSATSFITERKAGLHLLLSCCLSRGRHSSASGFIYHPLFVL